MTSSVMLTLDTTAPTLSVEVPKYVDPPEDLVVQIASSEDIGVASVALTDSLGTLTNLGYALSDPRSMQVVVPTVGLGSGPATLLVSVSDEVLNFTRQRIKVRIDRDQAFDVRSNIDRAYQIDPRLDSPYLLVSDLSAAYETVTEIL